MKITLPTWATVGLSLLAGLATVLNQTVLKAAEPWGAYITVGLVFVATLGIGPLTGPAFRAALHLSQTLATAVGASLAAIALLVVTLHTSSGVHALVLGLLTVAAGLGFAPEPQIVVEPTHTTHIPKPPEAPTSPPRATGVPDVASVEIDELLEIKLKKGAAVVVRTTRPLTAKQRTELTADISAVFPAHPVVVLTHGDMFDVVGITPRQETQA